MKILNGKYALITGASGGMGKAIAYQLAKEGVNLILTDINTRKLEQIKNELSKEGIIIEYISADLTQKEKQKQLIQFISSSLTRLDILIHSAGSILQSSVVDTTDEKLEELFKINLFVPFLLTRELLPLLKSSKGQIIFINSSAVQRPIPNISHYSASKHAMKGFADVLREEVNPEGIRVTSFYPGKTATEMQQKLYKENQCEYMPDKLIQPDDIAQAVVNALTMPQTVEITDIYLRPMQKS